MNNDKWKDLYGIYSSGDYSEPWDLVNTDTEPTLWAEPKCECGAIKTHGPKTPDWQHSDWCPMYKKDSK